jgi:TolB-like protein
VETRRQAVGCDNGSCRVLSRFVSSDRLGQPQGCVVRERLDSWKDIADYLCRDVRTVQRWERDRSLPVHRLPGGRKPRIYALRSELDLWLKGNPADPVPSTPSVAVLPFVNLSESRENEYFSDGLADEIINALTRIPGLRVTARTSSFAFRGREKDVREIGASLAAGSLLEGSVQRSGNRVRVSAQLVSAKDGYHLWSESYDRELADVFALQDDIARAVSGALSLRLAAVPLVEPSTEDMEAYRLWLQGRYAWAQLTPAAVSKARTCFEAALSRDPRFPLPYVGIAELLFDAGQLGIVPPAEVIRQAKEAVLTALTLNDRLGEAYALLGALHGVLEYDWAAAELCLQRAIDLSPGSATVLLRSAWFYLVPQLRIPEALDQMQMARTRDPLSPFVHSTSGLTLMVARDFERAIEECRIALDLAPGLYAARWFLGVSLIVTGKREEGLRECDEVYEHGGLGAMATGGMAAVYGMVGRMEESRKMLSELSDMARKIWVPPLAFAWAYLGLRDELVFEWLDRAIDARDPAVTHMPSMMIYDGIREDPRFRQLLAKMNLA